VRIYSSNQLKAIDAYTIEHEPVSSVDLMERAAEVLLSAFTGIFDRNNSVVIYAGRGNNGGDALALARLLFLSHYEVVVYLVDGTNRLSDDATINLERLHGLPEIPVHILSAQSLLPVHQAPQVIIDGLLGLGLNRPAEGLYAKLINHINSSPVPVFSIDIPSGMNADGYGMGAVISANVTVSFQFPKYAFLLPENERCLGNWMVLPIGLHTDFASSLPVDYEIIDPKLVKSTYRYRSRFAHKGTFGHTLIVAGSYGKIGAAVLATKAALRSGAGLVTAHVPQKGMDTIHSAIPEAMVQPDRSEIMVSKVDHPERFSAIGFGPGVGTKPNTILCLADLFDNYKGPLVIDADGLNILAERPDLLNRLPHGTVLTPHPKEFDRMFGSTRTHLERIELQRTMAKQYGVIIVLKGGYTSIADEKGYCYFNILGNAGMATGGMGDALTGIIAGLLGQGYAPVHAAITAVYLHAYAGDICAKSNGQEFLVASDVINALGQAFISISQ